MECNLYVERLCCILLEYCLKCPEMSRVICMNLVFCMCVGCGLDICGPTQTFLMWKAFFTVFVCHEHKKTLTDLIQDFILSSKVESYDQSLEPNVNS